MNLMRKIAHFLTRYELLLLALAAPLWLFPLGWLPWVGLALIGLTWLSRQVSTRHCTVLTGVELPALLLAIMALLGYSISVDPTISKPRFWNILLDLAVFFGLANGLRLLWGMPLAQRVRWLVAGVAVAALGVVGLSLVGTDWNQVRIFDLPWLYDRLPTLIRGLPDSGIAMVKNGLIHPRWVGITMGVLVPVLLACAAWLKDGWLRLLCAFTALLATGLLLLSQTLQGAIGLLAGLFFLLVWRSRWGLLLLLPVGALLLGGAYLVDPAQLGAILFSQDNPVGVAIVLRLDIWSRALAMIRDLPFTGIGLNTFSLVQWHFYPGHLLGPEPHAHNIYLQTALDMGLPGLAAFVWFFIAWGVRIWRNAKSRAGRAYNALLAGVAAGVVAYLTAGLMDAMMLGAKPSVLVWALMGMVAAPPSTEKNELPGMEQATLPKVTRLVLRVLPLIVLLGVGLVGLLLKPERLLLNLGAIQAHWGLYPAQIGASPDFTHLDRAEGLLLDAQAQDPDMLTAYELLGRISAWQGDPQRALHALSYRVALDGEHALLRYFPSGAWLRQLQGFTPAPDQDWLDLLKVYTNWRDRFPERSMSYAELGLVYQCYLDDPGWAASMLQAGIDKEALPGGLLQTYAGMLDTGDASLCWIR